MIAGRPATRLGLVGTLLALPALAGCGVAYFAVIGLALGGGGGSSTPGTPGKTITGPPPENQLFIDPFDGTLGAYTLCGAPAPAIDLTGGRPLPPSNDPNPGLDPAGSASASSEAVTNLLFRPGPGLAIGADVILPTSGSPNTEAWLAFRSPNVCDGAPTFEAGVHLRATIGQRDFYVGGTVVFTDTLLDTSWHAYQINLRTDCRVEFFVDGSLVYLSAANETVASGGLPGPVTLGGRSIGGAVRFDNLLVSGTPPTSTTVFRDGFANPTLPGYTFSPPAVPTNPATPVTNASTGQPVPSLDPKGSTSVSGEAVTTQAWNYATSNGLEIRADSVVPVQTTPNARIWFGLEQRVISASGAPDGFPDLAAGVDIDASADLLRYVVNGTAIGTETSDTAWHRFRVVIRSDSNVEFYRDGLLIIASASGMNASGSLNVSVGGRSAGGAARLDNLSVILPGAPTALRTNALAPVGTAPAARRFHSAIHDPEIDSMVIFGGFTSAGSGSLFSDTWRLVFDGAANGAGTWRQLTPGGTAPSARQRHSAVYDSLQQRMLVFGGRDATAPVNSVHALGLSGATGLNGTWGTGALTTTGSAPTGRQDHAAVFDATRNRMVVFGGVDASNTPLNQVWELSFAGGPTPAWSQLTPSGTPPSGRSGARAVWDAPLQRMLVTYGDDGTVPNPAGLELWELSFAASAAGTWTQILTLPSAPSPPAPLASPPRRAFHAVAGWPAERRLYLFGGYDKVSPSTLLPPSGTPNEAWLLDLSCGGPVAAFVGPTDLSTPPARQGHVLIWHPSGRRCVLFGGFDGTNDLADVWELYVP